MMTNPMLLRVAKAISRPEIWDDENIKRYGDMWILSARNEAFENARKAIEAMLDLTPEMEAAFHRLADDNGNVLWRSGYRAILTEALK